MHKQRLNYKPVGHGLALARMAKAVPPVDRGWRLVAAMLAFSGAPVAIAGEQTDITFVVAGKTSNHRQHPDGRVDVLNYHFFAEIFLRDGGRVSGATLLAPTRDAEAAALLDGGYALEHHGGRYATETELEAAYPDGDYLFEYTAASVGPVRQVVKLDNPDPGSSGLPPAPRIFLSQAGRPVEPVAVDPEVDLRVSWSPFNEGGADPGGIMDDLVFVIMADCHGARRAHSGRPFENTPFLTYADSHFDIAAGQLLPASVYQLSVEHAVLDTSLERGVIGFATFATTTFLDLRTTGQPVPGESCDTLRQPFDAGQTDFVPGVP